jgi:hypothetical protein
VAFPVLRSPPSSSPPAPATQAERVLVVDAGPYALALPLRCVRQILDLGGAQSTAPVDPRALGVTPISLAELLGAEPLTDRPGLLLVDGPTGPVLLMACKTGSVYDASALWPLPQTVVVRFGGLLRGVLLLDRPRLLLDPVILLGLVEAHEPARAIEPALAPSEPSAQPSKAPTP